MISVPPPYEWESPASWATRAALSQGVSISTFLQTIGIASGLDPDLRIAILKPEALEYLCGVCFDNKHVATQVFKNFRRAQLSPARFLLSERKKPRYRFCPHCLATQSTPFFSVYWRFSAWQHCPIHKCLMAERCPRCLASVTLPTSLINAGPRNQGLAYLSICTTCGHDLQKTATLGLDHPHVVGKIASLSAGRAIVNAIRLGYVRNKFDEKNPLEILKHVNRHD